MKSYIPTINISSLLDGKFVSKEAKKTIQSIKKFIPNCFILFSECSDLKKYKLIR